VRVQLARFLTQLPGDAQMVRSCVLCLRSQTA
jgi:hypothetical protein